MRFRSDRIWGWSEPARSPQSFKYGAAAVGAGIRFPAIGATGAGDGFRHTARRTGTMAAGVRIGGGEVRTTAMGVFTGDGKARMKGKVMMAVSRAIHSRSPRKGRDGGRPRGKGSAH